MLIDIVEQCSASIQDVATLRSNQQSIETYEEAVERLNLVENLVAKYTSTVAEMCNHDFCKMNPSANDIEGLKSSISDCAKSVNDCTLTKNDAATLTTLFDTQMSMVKVFWNSQAKKYVEPLCSYLGIVQTFSPQKDKISTLNRALTSDSSAEPTAAVVKRLAENAQKAIDISNNFQINDSVRSFLEKVRQGNATYADITTDIAKWIKEHRLASNIKISF